MTRGNQLARAIRETRRVRRNLVRLRGEIDFGGDCALASLLVADAVHDVNTLRYTEESLASPSPCAPHVWNEVAGVTLDVTATQFNDNSDSDDAGEPPVFGVLITQEPRIYHRPVAGRGGQTLEYLADASWYKGRDRRRLLALMARLKVSQPLLRRPRTA